MAERTVAVRLRAEIDGYKRAMREASDATDAMASKVDKSGNKIESALGRAVRSSQVHREEWTRAGAALTSFGVVSAAALTMSVNAAIDWETAWTGVLKTVDGSSDQLAQLEQDLRDMALVLPATQEEIAAVAETAGQLGVAVDDVAAFTKVMIDLGETTNLTSEEAATSIAQLMNVMQTAPEDVDNLGSALVDLGNNGASTERDIILMAQRIAGAGEIIGLSEGEVLGLANALASVGIEAEAGGSSVSNILIDIAKAVSTGSDDLEKWAEVAGVSADVFSQKWGEDAAQTFALVVSGLGDMQASGEDVFSTLEELGQKDVRVTRSLLSMATAGDLLSDSLVMGNEAWAQNTALVAEAEKRYDTTEAKLTIAQNAIRGAAIDLGESLLPAVASVAGGVANLAEGFSNLPAPLRDALGGIGAVTAGASLLGGGLLLLLPRIIETRQALKTLSQDIPAFGKLGKAAGAAAAAMLALQLGDTLARSMQNSAASVADTTAALLEMGDSAASVDALFQSLSAGVSFGRASESFDGIADAMDRVASPANIHRWNDFLGEVKSLGSAEGSTQREAVIQQFDALGESLASLVQSGHSDLAADQFEKLYSQIDTTKYSTDDLMALLPAYSDALATVENETKLAGEATEGMGGAIGGANVEVQSFADELDALNQLMREAAGLALDEWDAITALEAAYDGALAAAKENGHTLDENTEKGRANRDALSGMAKSALDLRDAQVAAGDSTEDINGTMADSREEFIKVAKRMGATKEEANDLADAFGLIPVEVNTVVTADTSQATSAINTYFGLLSSQERTRYAGAVTKKADGGAVFGPGTSTSDSIPAMLSNGEHVWSAREVAGAGGHAAMVAMREAARGNRFAMGGPVGNVSNVSTTYGATMQVSVEGGGSAEEIAMEVARILAFQQKAMAA